TRALARFSGKQKQIARAQALIQRHPAWFVIGTRFMYGFRIIGPLLIGASHVPPKLFVPLNILGALAWATLFTTLGYVGGQVIEPWLHRLDHHLKQLVWVVLAVGIVLLLRWLWRKRSSRED
ncbi:MAG: DedA family protein, partial [Cronobacter sakazakii]|nr:DedA family protein [Cronobacter sakazakii]